MLELNELVSGYGRDPILRGVTFAVPDAAITAVFGHNGAGKSSLVRALVGILPAWSGSLKLDGIELSNQPSRRRVELGLVASFQDQPVFPTLTVLQNLHMGGHVRWNDKAWLKARVEHVMTMFPRLSERAGQLAYTLSGGERRMLSIAMALISDPKVLILDEPSTGLSPGVTDFMFKTIQDIRDAFGKSIILIEQNVQNVLPFADKAVVLKTGLVSFDGAPRTLQEDPDLVMMF